MKKIKKIPFFSIVTCTYNSQDFLQRNIESVKCQVCKDYEHILIDGYSSDGTIKIINEYSKNNPKVKLFSYPPKGISDAFNYGIKNSQGKYLLFLNSDDCLYDKNVLKDVNIFLRKNPSLGWIYGKINVIEENGKSIGTFPKWKIFQISWKYLLKFINFIPHQAVLMKKSVFSKFGNFDTSLKTNMDFDLWLRIAKDTKWFFYNRIISNYMIRKGSNSSDNAKKYPNLDYLEVVQKRHLNYFEMIAAKIANRPMIKVNKTYR